MAEVKWIKITTDIFDDEKILLIESLPDSDSIIVIWFKLLCLAGKMNNSGVFTLNDSIVYTDEMLSTIFRRKETTVKMALNVFEEFGMIKRIDGAITIPNWGKHQTLDQLEKRREYQREYMREYREKQRQIADKSNCKTNSNVNVSSLGCPFRSPSCILLPDMLYLRHRKSNRPQGGLTSNYMVYRITTPSLAKVPGWFFYALNHQ